MIEDLDGVTTEPARRLHVVALSVLSAAVSLAVLAAFVVPPAPVAAPPLSASTAQSPAAAMTLISNPLSQLRVDLTRPLVCADGTRLVPPYTLVFDASGGRVVAMAIDGRTRPIAVVPVVDARTALSTVNCATSDVFAPREMFAR